MTPLDPSIIIPVRVLDAPERSWRKTTTGALKNGALALALNAMAIAGLVAIAVPRERPATEPDTIAVDLVSEVPTTGGGSKASVSKPTRATPPAGDGTAASSSNPSGAAEPMAAAKPGPTPQPSATPPADSATPPPVEGGNDPTPRLVEAPPDPRQAPSQPTKNTAANAETKPADTPKPTEVPPPPAPAVAAARTGDDVAPEAKRTAPAPVPAQSGAEQQRQADNTAKLAAALPLGQGFLPDFNRASLSGAGSAESQRYRGMVYGSFRKADDLLADAQARHLRGRAVVVFSIDDGGALTSVHIAVSSGDPAVDQTAMDIIRRSAPYPPPPPGAQRTFSPAIALGLDEP